ncbi:MAG: hypothetical protein LBH66_06240 [Oscillospiraceae bacterium]|nr:hypothetical protein [Oscillospiraceae bacterium]
MYSATVTHAEAAEFFDRFWIEPRYEGMRAELFAEHPRARGVIGKAMGELDRAMASEGEYSCALYGDEVNTLVRFNERIPYWALKLEDASSVEFISVYTALISNLTSAFPSLSEALSQSAGLAAKTLFMGGSYTALLLLTDRLLRQARKTEEFMPETIFLSQRYAKLLTGED